VNPGRHYRVASAALVVVCLLALVTGAGRAGASVPSNDDFGNATVLSGAGGTLTTDNTDATKEPGEPNHAGDAGGHSIWFSWTPNFTGVASIDTFGSSFDTLLAAYTGGSVSSLNQVASSDDVGDTASVSRICFPVSAGASTFLIAVDGYDGDQGALTLNWGQKTDTAPCPMVPPSISGPSQPKVGDQLFLASGNFVEGGGSMSIEWSRCTEALCVAIPGATSGAYTVGPQDVGNAIRVDEAITNSGGTADGTSDPTAVVSMTATTHTNGRIFWTTSRDGSPGQFDIHSMFPDGSSPEQLTASAGFTTEPAPSPDGTLVAFVDSGELKLMNADGTGVVDLGVQGTYPTWSPDGSRIAFVTGAGIESLDEFGNDVTLIPLAPGSTSGRLDWSPDGSQIAFGYRFPGHADLDIAVAGADGRGTITQITTSPVDDHDPAWSPTGDRLAFDRGPAAGAITDGDLYVIDANGTNEAQLYNGDATHVVTFGVDWSPDGQSILFSRWDNGNSDLFTIPAAGGSLTQLTTDGHRDELATWGQLASFELSVAKAGSGSGTVTGAGGGISCGATCSASFADATTVTLTPAAASGSTFTGWSGACSGTGPCIVSMLGDRTVTATFAAVSSGGGGGGGGGTSVPNLGTSIVVKTNPIAPGEVDELTIFVKNAGGAGSLQTDLKIQLPASLTLLGPPYYERGSGCTGTTSIDCFLDYLPNGETTKVIFDVRATATGPQTVTAVVTSDRDSDATDNTATLILQVGSPLPPPVSPPPPPLPSPVLAQLPNRVLQAVRKGGTESVVARFSTNESLHLGMTVTRDGSTRLLRLLKGTRLAAATAPSARLTLTGTAARAGAYSLHVLLARSGLVKGKTYVIRIAARNRDGKRATLKIRFRA
jgi:hypothetical protein